MDNLTANDIPEILSRNSDKDNYNDDDSVSHLVWILVLSGLVGIWCVAFLISTKGCRDCRYHENSSYTTDDPVWRSSRQRRQIAAEDYRIAVELRRQEAVAATQQALQAREAWIQKIFARHDNNKIVLDDDNDFDENAQKYKQQSCCPICLAEYSVATPSNNNTNKNNVAIVLRRGVQCGHVFHESCIAGALLRSKDCPVCRQVFLAQEVVAVDDDDDKHQNNDNHDENGGAVTQPPNEQPVGSDEEEAEGGVETPNEEPYQEGEESSC